MLLRHALIAILWVVLATAVAAADLLVQDGQGLATAIDSVKLDTIYQEPQLEESAGDALASDHKTPDAYPALEDGACPQSQQQSVSELGSKTIYQALKENTHYFQILALVNLTADIVNILNDTSANITFFAPSNDAFSRHRTHGHHGDHGRIQDASSRKPDDSMEHAHDNNSPQRDNDMYATSGVMDAQLDLMHAIEHIITLPPRTPEAATLPSGLVGIVRRVLLYHIVPFAVPSARLGEHATLATKLTLRDGSLDGSAMRVQTTPKFINSYATLRRELRVSNGGRRI
ncbi:uncharacterized protein C8Q71DRAFT_225561 [Rhodofomes roseus]|uniref:FAS1 domain-containing protein n=1 Tax=Rhodofomes roseus TaxID=34475 RepID=A0ABQ8KVK3_9APHY|nr:uncharacterized protein C8Q71DRAFT_225561 [Rhodofomes roseus]KAH9842877.1 hypothetical protein C8Q71DRAFT_225561 [Rhodofomes roseus]